MKRNIYKIGFFAMLLINVGFAMLIINRPHHLGPEGQNGKKLKKEVGEILSLTEQEEQKFFALADEHAVKMRSLNEEHRKLAGEYFSLLKSNNNSVSEREVLLDAIGRLETEKLRTTYNHLLDVREINQESDSTVFYELIEKLIPRITGQRQPGPPPSR
ncbi:MAG: hypothetical protein WBA74_19175 [Cyclobacteriaceae bacterium]